MNCADEYDRLQEFETQAQGGLAMTHFREDPPRHRRAFTELGGTRNFFGAALVLGLGLTGISQAATPPQYSLTDLGTFGGSTSAGYGINARGQVTGTASTTGNVHTHAFRYSHCSMQDLGTLGGSDSTGQGINASGQVTGNSDIMGDATFHAFLYSNGVMKDIDPFGSGSYSTGSSINARGQITGSEQVVAFLYSNGSMQVLTNVLGYYSAGSGINASGEIVGVQTLYFGLGTGAFIYANGTVLTVVSGDVFASGAAINDSGSGGRFGHARRLEQLRRGHQLRKRGDGLFRHTRRCEFSRVLVQQRQNARSEHARYNQSAGEVRHADRRSGCQ
jgi:probable HAF family extracellular repeat protein